MFNNSIRWEKVVSGEGSVRDAVMDQEGQPTSASRAGSVTPDHGISREADREVV